MGLNKRLNLISIDHFNVIQYFGVSILFEEWKEINNYKLIKNMRTKETEFQTIICLEKGRKKDVLTKEAKKMSA